MIAGPQHEPACRIVPRRAALVVGVVVLAGLLRLTALERYPIPVNHDELSNIYDGWSIAQTGADRSGRRWPILCYGFGPSDNRPALFAWLCAGVSWWTGFSVSGCRAISGVVGTATVALVGLWGLRVLGCRGAMLGMLLLAVSPWHVGFSRSANEGGALPGFFCVAIILLIRRAGSAVTKDRMAGWWWAAAGGLIGFSTNAYGASRLTGLLFAIVGAGVLIAVAVSARLARRRMGIILLVFVMGLTLGAGPQLYALATNTDDFLNRAQTVRFHANSWWDAVETFSRNVLANLHPRYLFYSFGEPNRGSAGRCAMVSLPFFYIGLLTMCLRNTGWSRVDRVLLLAGVLICVSPAALTRTNPHALRASGCAVLFPMIAGLGIIQAGRWMVGIANRAIPGSAEHPRRLPSANWAAVLAGIIIVGCGGWNVVRYLRSDTLPAFEQQPELVELGKWLRNNADGYDRICIEPRGNEWDLYVAAFSGMTPPEFQQADRRVWGRYIEFCTQLNRYHFITRQEALRQWQASAQNERWLLLDVARTFEYELGGPSSLTPDR